MANLTYLEQSAQMLFFQCYLEMYRFLCEYEQFTPTREAKQLPGSLFRLKAEMEKEMKNAQTEWRKKHYKPFWDPILAELRAKVGSVVICLSPKCCKRKRLGEGGPSSKRGKPE